MEPIDRFWNQHGSSKLCVYHELRFAGHKKTRERLHHSNYADTKILGVNIAPWLRLQLVSISTTI
jgi:hypothetical protein